MFFDQGGADPRTWAGDASDKGKEVGGSWLGYLFSEPVKVGAVVMAQGSGGWPGLQGVRKVWLEGSNDDNMKQWERVADLTFEAPVDTAYAPG